MINVWLTAVCRICDGDKSRRGVVLAAFLYSFVPRADYPNLCWTETLVQTKGTRVSNVCNFNFSVQTSRCNLRYEGEGQWLWDSVYNVTYGGARAHPDHLRVGAWRRPPGPWHCTHVTCSLNCLSYGIPSIFCRDPGHAAMFSYQLNILSHQMRCTWLATTYVNHS